MRRWRWLWLPLAFFLACAGWALTSPAGSAPDDDYHLASIWCAAGQCTTDPADSNVVLVPRAVAQASECFRYEASVTADCARGALADPAPVPVTHVNDVEHLYPSGYYRTMGLFVGGDVERSVLMMRLANAGLVSLLLALLLRTVPAGISFATTVAALVTFIPLGFFVVASTNPSGWASAGVVLFWGFALALLHRHDWRSRRTWLVAAGALVTALMAVTSRVDASAYLAFTAVLVLVIGGLARIRANRGSAAVVAALGLLGVTSYLLASGPAVAGGEAGMGTASRGVGLLLTNAVYLPALFQGIVGGWALGWNDTVMPPVVPIVGVLAIGGLAWAGLSSLWPRKTAGVVLAAVALAAVPLIFLQKEGLGVGEVVQPRYIMPLLGLVLATLLLPPRPSRPLTLPRAPVRVLVVGLWLSGMVAFWANAHRYAYGSGVGLFDIRVQPAWVGLTAIPLLLITLAMAATTAVLVSGVFVPSRHAPQVQA